MNVNEYWLMCVFVCVKVYSTTQNKPMFSLRTSFANDGMAPTNRQK